jgi:hypothetical protein
MGLDYDELFPGRFLKSGEFQGKDVTLKIASIQIEELSDEKGTPNKEGVRVRTRGIISFERTKKQLCLNRTNGECLKALWGRKTDDWIGHRVTFFPAVVDAFGEETTAIRVRGSPDIDKPITFQARIGRKQVTARLLPTGQKSASNGKPVNGNQVPARAQDPLDDKEVLPNDEEPPESPERDDTLPEV